MTTTQRCIYCARDLPMHRFRRWSHGKSRLKPYCTLCVPPKTLKQMSKAEREHALLTSHRNWSPQFVKDMGEREREHYLNTVLPEAALRAKQHERTHNWDSALLDRLREEHRWAKAASLRYSTKAQEDERYIPFHIFYAQYTSILARIKDEAYARSVIKGAPVKPTVEQINPLTYITPQEHTNLRYLYSQCTPIPGARAARDPWFLYWRQ